MTRERYEYLREVADEYGVPLKQVLALASVLGPNEDHDGLISMVEDMLPMFG